MPGWMAPVSGHDKGCLGARRRTLADAKRFGVLARPTLEQPVDASMLGWLAPSCRAVLGFAILVGIISVAKAVAARDCVMLCSMEGGERIFEVCKEVVCLEACCFLYASADGVLPILGMLCKVGSWSSEPFHSVVFLHVEASMPASSVAGEPPRCPTSLLQCLAFSGAAVVRGCSPCMLAAETVGRPSLAAKLLCSMVDRP